jgi:hypothetical protein
MSIQNGYALVYPGYLQKQFFSHKKIGLRPSPIFFFAARMGVINRSQKNRSASGKKASPVIF